MLLGQPGRYAPPPTTVEILLRMTGGSPLVTLTEMAEILRRTPDGLRVILSRDCEISRQLNPLKKRIGRRIFFDLVAVARFIDDAAYGESMYG